MTTRWPKVPLGELLRPTWRQEVVDPSKTYSLLGARWYSGGLFIKDVKSGGEIRADYLYRVQSGDFVYNRLFAWKGSFAIAGNEADGCYVSGEFPCFEVVNEQIDGRFLCFYFQRASSWSEALSLSMGATPTSRNRLKETFFLKMEIPLPPLAEQRRIVARIEELAAEIQEVRTLRQQAAEEAEKIFDATKGALFGQKYLQNYRTRLGDADIQLNGESRNPSWAGPEGSFIYVDISSVGRGPSMIRTGKRIPTEEAPSRARRVIRKNDLVISTVRPNLRSFAKVGEELDNQICSTGFAVITCGQSLNPDFLLHQFCSPFIVEQCMDRKTGGHYPAINDSNLRNILIIVPPLTEQYHIVAELNALQAQIVALKQLQAETAAELDALLPSILNRAFKGEL